VNPAAGAAGFVVESYFQGVDIDPNIAVGGSFSSSVNEFTLNGATIIPLVPEPAVSIAGLFGGLMDIGRWISRRPLHGRP